MLRGSTEARLRVIASDGIRTAMATSQPFTLAPHAPQPAIDGVMENARVPFGVPLHLTGLALDAEDGSLDGDRLQWELAGPVNDVRQGTSWSRYDLTPGDYIVTLTALDSSDTPGVAQRQQRLDATGD